MPSGKVDAAVRRGEPGRDAGGAQAPQEQVEQLCGQFSQVYPVNYNCPGQLVVSCSEQEKQALCEQVKALGGKAVELAVSGGFHSPFMSRAAEQMQEHLSSVSMHAPVMPVYANSTALPYPEDTEEGKRLLSQQIDHPVLWEKRCAKCRRTALIPSLRWVRAKR